MKLRPSLVKEKKEEKLATAVAATAARRRQNGSECAVFIKAEQKCENDR